MNAKGRRTQERAQRRSNRGRTALTVPAAIAALAEPVTDHAFRRLGGAEGNSGRRGAVRSGMCAWLGTCNRPRADHITLPDFRARREAAR